MMEGIAALLKRASRGVAPESLTLEASRVPYALRFSKFKTPEEFEAAGRQLGERYRLAASDAERAAIEQEINALQNSFLKFEGATASKAARFGDEAISPNERMVLQSKYGEDRVLDPRTGYPQSVNGQPLRYDYTDPFEQMAKRLNQLEGHAAETPSGIDYLYRQSRALGVDGKPIVKVGPNNEYQKFEGFTPGQRLAQAGAAGTVVAGLGAAGMRDRESPISNYTGDDVDAAAYADKYAARPAPAPAPQFMPNYGMNQFNRDMGRTYTGDDVDAVALARKYSPAVAAPAPAQAAPAAPARQASAPAAAPREEGFLSRALRVSDPDRGMSSREMFERMQRDARGDLSFSQDESPSAYFRAASRAREEMEGRASGGAANGKPNKDAALHKALEIIQMMLSRR